MIPSVAGLLPIEKIIFELHHGLNGYRTYDLSEIRNLLNIHHNTIIKHLNSATYKIAAMSVLSSDDRIEYKEYLESCEGYIGEYRHPCLGFIKPSDRVVVVLGNGASISEVKCQSSEAETPPTDIDFLKRARSLHPTSYNRLERLFHEVWADGAPCPMKYQRMEQLFANSYLMVQESIGSTKEGKLARQYFDQLTVLLRDTLSTTTSNIHSTQHYEYFNHIMKASPQSMDIISFNYDVLADRALLHGNNAGVWDWSYTDGYGFKPLRQKLPRIRSNVKLLKLHGSMNWYIPVPGRGRQRAYKSNDPIYIPKPQATGGAPIWQRKQKRQGNRKQYVFPLIIPPIYEKRNLINSRLQLVWDNAKEALSNATVVIIWGYSMPITDYHAEALFAQCARKAKFKLIGINPDRDALSRITSVCGHKWIRWFFRMGHLFNVYEGTID